MSVKITSKGKSLLKQKIAKTEARLKDVISQKGEAYENGGNGWHDNFSFEQLVREESTISLELNKLKSVLESAEEVDSYPKDSSMVSIGSKVSLENDDGEIFQYVICGYGESDLSASPLKVEYLAPIVKPFLGENIGAEHKVLLSGKVKSLKLVRIEGV